MTILAFLAMGLLLACVMLARRCISDASLWRTGGLSLQKLPLDLPLHLHLPIPHSLVAVPNANDGDTTIYDTFHKGPSVKKLLKIWTRRTQGQALTTSIPRHISIYTNFF
jgi:hypothetical protein